MQHIITLNQQNVPFKDKYFFTINIFLLLILKDNIKLS